jgi:hypothetical protein
MQTVLELQNRINWKQNGNLQIQFVVMVPFMNNIEYF